MNSIPMGAAAFFIVLATACGGATDKAASTDAGAPDAIDVDTSPPDMDAGPPDVDPINPMYPAPHTPMPLVDNNGDRVIHNPKVVSITWAGDDTTLVPRLQQFDDTITSTPYWTTTTSEYCEANGGPCIGAGVAGEHVVISTPPPSMGFTDSSQGAGSTIQAWLQDQVTNNTSMPAPTLDTIYAIYLPANVDIILDGTTGCSGGFAAYHNTITLNPSAVTTAYAVLPRCSSKESTMTVSASHEFVEAVTDPDIGLGQQFLTFYMLNPTWTQFGGGEVGDLCEFGFGSQNSVRWTESGFTVQRTWSNKSAKAGHNPCVPIPTGEVYFNVAPRKQSIVLPKVGSTAVLDLDAFSDAPLPDWNVTAFDSSQFQGGTSHMSFTFDQSTAHNGSHLQLTVTLQTALTQGTIFGIVSQGGNGQTYTWPVLASP